MKGYFEDKKYLYWGITALIVVAIAVIANQMLARWYVVTDLGGVLAVALRPIILGVVFAYVFNPLMKIYEKHIFSKLFKKLLKKNDEMSTKMMRGTSIVVTIATISAIVAWLLVLIIPELYGNIERLILNLPDYIEKGIAYINELAEDHSDMILPVLDYLEQFSETALTWVQEKLIPNANSIITRLSTGIYGVLKFLLDFIIGLIVAVYLLFSKEKYCAGARKLTYAVFKKEHAHNIIRIVRFADDRFGGFIVGKVLDSAIIGCLSFVVFSLFDIPYTTLVSVIVGVTNVIPFFGPFLGAIPCGVLILFVDPIKALTFAILILAIQQLDGNVIGPKILGDRTGLDSFAVIFAILLSGGIFGIPGMILGVPVFATAFGIIRGVCNMWLKRKQLPVELDAYESEKTICEISHIENNEE